MKHTIAWHEYRLKNMQDNLVLETKVMELHRNRLLRLQDNIHIRIAQIAEAKKRGMDRFDADKLLRKRNV